ncbi:MAG TPA: hypothetical protein EYQ33_01290 [Gammaproteobacteria bacterium]|nr:hypothetical protein [Gammaproteobacteria bacterium]
MKKVSWDTWIQLLGMLSVLAGLVFVGLEMRQSQQIALAAQQQARTEIFTGIVNSVNESSEVSLYQILVKARDNEPLTASEKKITENYALQTIWVFENDFIQYQAGLIDEDVWLAKLFSVRTLSSLCHFRDAAEYLLQFTSAVLTDLVDVVPKSNCEE